MGTSPINITVKMNAQEATQGFPQLATSVKSSTDSMKADFNATSVTVEELKAEIVSLQASIAELQAQSEGGGVAHLTSEVTEARHAAHLLGDEIGVKIPRALQGVLAKSELLGPVLANAFGALAVAGFVELAIKAGEKLSELISDTWIFTEAQKELDKVIKAQNAELDSLEKKHIANLREEELIGKSEAQQAAIKAKWAQEDFNAGSEAAAQVAERREELTKELELLREKQAIEKAKQIDHPTILGALGIDTGPLKEIDKQIDKVNQELGELPGAQLANARFRAVGDAAVIAFQRAGVAADKEWKEELKRREEATKVTSEAITRMLTEQQRLSSEKSRMELEDTMFGVEQENKLTEAALKSVEARIAAENKFRTEREHDDEQAAVAAIAQQQKQIENQVNAQQGGVLQEVAQLKALAKQKLDVETQYIDARSKEITDRLLTEDGEAYAKDLDEWSKLLTQKKAAENSFNAEIIAADKKREDELKRQQQQQAQQQKQQLDRMTSQFNNSLNEWITGQKTFGQAMAQMWRQMVDQMILQLLRGIEQEIIVATIRKGLAKDGIESQAHEAAAKAWNWGVGIGGPIVGAIDAAAVFAAVSALNAFEKGGIVPETNVALLHKNEMVLPSHISQKVQSMAEPAKAGGDTHVHLGVSAIDGPSVGKFFSSNSGKMRREIQRMVRNGKGL